MDHKIGMMILSMMYGLLLLSVPSNASCEEVPLKGGTPSLLIYYYFCMYIESTVSAFQQKGPEKWRRRKERFVTKWCSSSFQVVEVCGSQSE